MLARDARGRMQRPTAEADKSPEPDALDEADEFVAMSDADFYRQARSDIEGIRKGLIPSIVAAQRQSPKRPSLGEAAQEKGSTRQSVLTTPATPKTSAN